MVRQPKPGDNLPEHLPWIFDEAGAAAPPEVTALLTLADRLADAVLSWKSGHIVEGHAREYRRFRDGLSGAPTDSTEERT